MAKDPADVDNREFLKTHGYLAQHGAALLDNGYHPIPIKVGSKAPGFDGWEKSRATKMQVEEWIEHGHKWSGVGIITKNTPALDIDVLDVEVAEIMENFIRELVGDAPTRVGKAPKRLMLFRTDAPFSKMRSAVYIDEWMEKQQIEILGEGQQCVAFHKHPETGKDYTWTTAANPLNTRANDLPTLTVEQCESIIAKFEELATERGWELFKAKRQKGKPIDLDNPFLEDTAPVDLSTDKIREKLLLVPNPDDYDTWVQVGMALYHQFDGDEDPGLKLWHEWSETADNYDADGLDRRWDDFRIVGKKKAPITARFILRMAQEAIEKTAEAVGVSLADAFNNAKTLPEWEAARRATREAEVDGLTRSGLATCARDARERITRQKTPLAEIKKAIAYSPSKGEKTPGWLRPWVYDTADDRFYSTVNKISVSMQGFNAMFDRESLTKKDALDGRGVASQTAADLALKIHKIDTVNGRRYEPGQDAVFYAPDGTFANTYPEHEIPAVPEVLLPRDKKNVDRVRNHVGHLLDDVREQRMFVDWMSWIVQNPGMHANYAILLQGVEGDGKSFFAQMLRAVMGVSNVRMLNAHIFESDFTDWGAGQCVNCVEEVRIIKSHNKFEVINRIKPFITNDIIEIHPKGGRIFNCKNTSSYLLFTNYKDALPIDEDSRRYLVLFSKWQQKSKLEKFVAENPDYYDRLYNAIEQSPGAIRKWLLEHEQADDFKPRGNAPITRARQIMITKSKPQFIQDLDAMIREKVHPLISEELLDMSILAEQMMQNGSDWPQSKALNSMLEREHWEQVGRIKVGAERVYFWSRNANRWRQEDDAGGYVDTQALRTFRDKAFQDLDDL